MVNENTTSFADDPALRAKQAMAYLSLRSPTSFYALVKSGDLPQGIIIGGRARVWRRSWLNAYLDACQSKSLEAVQ